MKPLTPTLSLALALVLPAAARADTIYRTDGPPIEDCRVRTENAKAVQYRDDDGDKREIASDKVVRIEYERVPKLLDSARSALAEGDFAGAMGDVEDYLDAILANEKGDTKYPWAPAYAMFRLVELSGSVGDLNAVIAAADRLIGAAPDSLYVPLAYLAKADALKDLDKTADARNALQDLQNHASEQGLSDRWRLEAELSLALSDAKLKGDKLRDRLDGLVDAADAYPTVLNRAQLGVAESYLLDKEYDAAETILTRTIESGKADERTMAGAWTGLGDCQYQRAVDLFKAEKPEEAQPLVTDAVLSYMRVVEVYEGQSRYVAKALFFAGRAFDQLQDDVSQDRARRMYREVMRQFPESTWASQARERL